MKGEVGAPLLATAQGLLQLSRERRRIDGGVPVKFGNDRSMQFAQPGRLNQAMLQHRLHVILVACVAALSRGSRRSADAVFVGQLAQATARWKLTRIRIKALYRECAPSEFARASRA